MLNQALAPQPATTPLQPAPLLRRSSMRQKMQRQTGFHRR